MVGFGTAQAEQRPYAPSASGWISDLGSATFSDAGGMFLPLSVIDGMKSGSLSPIIQFALINHTIDQCTKQAISKTPDVRAPFVVAQATFVWGVCLMQSCLKNILLMQLIPLLSQKYGTQSDQQSAQQQGAVLAQSFQQAPGCNGAGDSGIDPMLAAAFGK